MLPSSTFKSSRSASLVEPLESRIAPATLGPIVLSIDRQTPTAETTDASSVVFKVTFSESVTGVNAADFKVFTDDAAKANSTVAVSGSGSSYNVTVSGLKGNGVVRLDLVDDDTILGTAEMPPTFAEGDLAAGAITSFPLGGSGLHNGSFTGQSYQLLQSGPTVLSFAPIGAPITDASSVSYLLTFSEPVTGVDKTDFSALLGKGLTGPVTITVAAAAGSGGAGYKVTATGYTGSGFISLELIDNGSIKAQPASGPDFTLTETETTGPNPASVATGDVNGDGKPDVVVANATYSSGTYSVSVLLGAGDGTLGAKQDFVVGSNPNSVALADVNGDGKLDIVATGTTFDIATSASHFVSVLLGNGDGTFQTRKNFGDSFDTPLAVAVGDLNQDGKPDLAVSMQGFSGLGSVRVLLGNGDGTFQSGQAFATVSAPRDVQIADLNGDGNPDVVTPGSTGKNLGVLLGTGTGLLGTVSVISATIGEGEFFPESVAVADMNGDGKPDLVIGGRGVVSQVEAGGIAVVTLGAGNGSFGALNNLTTGYLGEVVGDVEIADFDGDGRLDVVLTAEGSGTTAGVYFLPGNGDGSVGPQLQLPSSGGGGRAALAVADFDGDARADLATVNSGGIPGEALAPAPQVSSGGSVEILLNPGGTISISDEIIITTLPSDLAITSITDGKSDAAAGDLLTYAIAYKNLGTKAVTNAVITVQLPEELSFKPKENPGWTLSGSTLTKTIKGKLAGGKSGTTKLKLHVDETVSSFTSGINTVATITDPAGEDFDFQNNIASDYDNLVGFTPDLAITKIDDGGFATLGQAKTYKIYFDNLGNRDANAEITVTLPDDTTFTGGPVGKGQPGWTDNMDGTYTYSTLEVPVADPEGSVEFTVLVDANASTDVPLSITATIASKFTQESNLENNELTEQTPFYSGIYVTSPGVAVGKKFAEPVIRVFDRATGLEVRSFFAYEPEYRDSIRVAVADFNNDGYDDIATTTQKGTGRLRVFDGLTGEQFTTGAFAGEIAVFDGVKDKGAFVAAGDVNGDGRAEVVVGSALGGGKVRVYIDSGEGLQMKEIIPFGAKFKGGVRVAVADLDQREIIIDPNDSEQVAGIRQFGSFDEIIVGMGYFGGQVNVYNAVPVELEPTDTVAPLALIQDFTLELRGTPFQVGGKGYRGGVSVGAGDVNGDGIADIITGRNSGKPSVVEAFSGVDYAKFGPTFTPFDVNPLKPKNTFGVRVAVVDIDLDGFADIITSVGVKNASQVKIYDGQAFANGDVQLLEDRTITVYPKYPDVALWVAGSRDRLILL